MQILNYVSEQYYVHPRTFIGCVAFVVALCLFVVYRNLIKEHLKDSCKEAAPIEIDGEYYYVVPQHQYLHSSLNHSERD